MGFEIIIIIVIIIVVIIVVGKIRKSSENNIKKEEFTKKLRENGHITLLEQAKQILMKEGYDVSLHDVFFHENIKDEVVGASITMDVKGRGANYSVPGKLYVSR